MAALHRRATSVNQDEPWTSSLITLTSTTVEPLVSAATLLRQRRILIVEGDYLVALDIAQALEEAGAQVAGIASSVGTALALIARAGRLDGAVVDIDLRGGMASPVADELARHGVPFLFTTACEPGAIPARFAHIIRCEKPFAVSRIVPLLLEQQFQRVRTRAQSPRLHLTHGSAA